MNAPESSGRALAKRVAKLLLEKGQTKDAVAILAAWAATGENNGEGQELMAEALRVDPGSEIAKAAFIRMEGLPGDAPALDEAIARFTVPALGKLEADNRRPVFHRAQVGFNNNVKYKGAVYHVQTEDSGIDRPHLITHLFADGGRVIKSHKRSYAREVERPDITAFVRALMKAQHLEMCLMLREAEFDKIIAGEAPGGLSVLEGPPDTKVRRGAGEAVVGASEPPAIPSSMVASKTQAKKGKARVRLTTLRSLWGGPEKYEPLGDDLVIGSREADIKLAGETFCAPREAVIRYRDGHVSLVDLEGGNGVFVRTRNPVELVFGDEFLVGDQLLRLEANEPPNDEPGPGPTYFYSSPQWSSSFRIVHLWDGDRVGAVRLARGAIIQVGRTTGDVTFPNDPLVSEAHCVVEEQAGVVVLTDLGSRAGTFVRVTGERELSTNDQLAIGRTRLQIDL